jgi:hypothetical protein
VKQTKPSRKRTPPPPIDPKAAIASLAAWWTQARAVISELEEQAGAIHEELQKPDCPWLPYVNVDALDGFCWCRIEMMDNFITPPFRPMFPAANPMAGLK